MFYRKLLYMATLTSIVEIGEHEVLGISLANRYEVLRLRDRLSLVASKMGLGWPGEALPPSAVAVVDPPSTNLAPTSYQPNNN